MDSAAFLPAETIRRKRDGDELAAAEIAAFVRGLVDGEVGGEQAAAFAMATWFRGMTPAEIAALTFAMRDSGEVLAWDAERLGGPVLDKHSTGGVGDLVSLPLGPMLAACGAFVPMISGRGLGHTGGTLDKLEAIPGYCTAPPRDRFLAVVHEAGVAIVGADARVAPADRRLYAIRDVSATVDSIALITASILSKKLAAGLGALVLDVKTGNGAVLTDFPRSHALAASLVRVATLAGLPCRALLTDMSQPLAPVAGNALEVLESVRMLRGEATSARLADVTLGLGAEALVLGGVAADVATARTRLEATLRGGAAAERFARMVAGLGGPADFIERAEVLLPRAPVVRDVPALDTGTVAAIDTRALGLVVVLLGGGRRHPAQAIDPAVGLDGLQPLGAPLVRGQPLARVHAASDAAAAAAVAAVQAAYRLADTAPPAMATVIARMDAAAAAAYEDA